MAYQHHSDDEFTKLETQYASTVSDMRSTIDNLHAELSELAKVAHATLDERDSLRTTVTELVAQRDYYADQLQSCERSFYGAIDDLGRAWEMAKIWKAAAKRSWGKLHYHQDKVPSAAERATMPPLCDYCHTRHYGYQDHDMA